MPRKKKKESPEPAGTSGPTDANASTGSRGATEASEATDASRASAADPAEAPPAEAGASAAGRDDAVRALEEKLEAAEREAAAQADRALRTLAEFDNYRRRVQRDLAEADDRGAASVLGEMLEVVDNFDRALEHAGDDVPSAFLEGMRLVARGLHDILERRGVARLEAVGAPFDPELHEALTSQPSEDAEPNTVLLEVQTGWRLGDRVLRPAKVVVARAVESGSGT